MIGKQGADQIFTELTRSHPKEVIAKFQSENGMRKENAGKCQPALKLLDLHNMPRPDIYKNILSSLRQQLLDKVAGLDQDKLKTLLEETFPYISFEELKAVPYAIMKRLKSIPLPFVMELAHNPELYHDSPVEVRRQIWRVNDELFKNELTPFMKQHSEEMSHNSHTLIANQSGASGTIISSVWELLDAPVLDSRKRRQQNSALQELLRLVGDHVTQLDLYKHACTLLKQGCLAALALPDTADGTCQALSYCTLRGELLMALHDMSSELTARDSSYKLAWGLDACLREGVIDTRRVRELDSFLLDMLSTDGRVTATPVTGSDMLTLDTRLRDASMIARDPWVLSTVTRSIWQQLQALIATEELPKNDETLRFLNGLLNLALNAPTLIKVEIEGDSSNKKTKKEKKDHVTAEGTTLHITRSKAKNRAEESRDSSEELSHEEEVKVPRATKFKSINYLPGDETVMRKFYPKLLSAMVDNMLEVTPSFMNDQLFLKLFKDNRIARKMTLYYYLTRLRERDIDTLTALTSLLGTISDDLLREVEFIHSAVSELILLKDERIAKLILDHLSKFRHVSLWLHRQLSRYLLSQTHLHTREIVTYLSDWIQRPDAEHNGKDYYVTLAESTELQSLYQQLLDKFGNRLNDRNAKHVIDAIYAHRSQPHTSDEPNMEVLTSQTDPTAE